jgi:hypothetical protein
MRGFSATPVLLSSATSGPHDPSQRREARCCCHTSRQRGALHQVSRFSGRSPGDRNWRRDRPRGHRGPQPSEALRVSRRPRFRPRVAESVDRTRTRLVWGCGRGVCGRRRVRPARGAGPSESPSGSTVPPPGAGIAAAHPRRFESWAGARRRPVSRVEPGPRRCTPGQGSQSPGSGGPLPGQSGAPPGQTGPTPAEGASPPVDGDPPAGVGGSPPPPP